MQGWALFEWLSNSGMMFAQGEALDAPLVHNIQKGFYPNHEMDKSHGVFDQIQFASGLYANYPNQLASGSCATYPNQVASGPLTNGSNSNNVQLGY